MNELQPQPGREPVPRLLTMEEMAEYLRLDLSTIKRWTAKRRLPFYKIGKTVRYDLEKVQRWLNRLEAKPEFAGPVAKQYIPGQQILRVSEKGDS